MALAMKATVETTVAIAAATCQSIDGIMSRHYLREKSAATVFFVVNRNFHFKSYFRLAPTTVRLQTQSSSPVLSQRRFPPHQWASSCPARSRNARKCRFSNRFRRQFSFPHPPASPNGAAPNAWTLGLGGHRFMMTLLELARAQVAEGRMPALTV